MYRKDGVVKGIRKERSTREEQWQAGKGGEINYRCKDSGKGRDKLQVVHYLGSS